MNMHLPSGPPRGQVDKQTAKEAGSPGCRLSAQPRKPGFDLAGRRWSQPWGPAGPWSPEPGREGEGQTERVWGACLRQA